jgi:hypothetical protein
MIYSTATVPVNTEGERLQKRVLSTLKRTRELLAEGKL